MAPRARAVFSLTVVERVDRRAKKALNFLGVMDGTPLTLRGGETGVLSARAAVAVARAGAFSLGLDRTGGSRSARPSSPAMASGGARRGGRCRRAGGWAGLLGNRSRAETKGARNKDAGESVPSCLPWAGSLVWTGGTEDKVRSSRITKRRASRPETRTVHKTVWKQCRIRLAASRLAAGDTLARGSSPVPCPLAYRLLGF